MQNAKGKDAERWFCILPSAFVFLFCRPADIPAKSLQMRDLG
jgi:hypothetical protein